MLTLIATLWVQGKSPTYSIRNEDTRPVIRSIGVSHTAYKDEFRQNLRSHSWWIEFIFFNTSSCVIEDFVETYLGKLYVCVIFRSRVLLGVCVYRSATPLPWNYSVACTGVNRMMFINLCAGTMKPVLLRGTKSDSCGMHQFCMSQIPRNRSFMWSNEVV